MKKLTIDDLELAGKRVLCRVDFNVPLEGGVVTDDRRIRAALPTIRAILDAGASLVLMSHLGRPDGAPSPELSLAPVRDALAGILARPVAFAEDCVGERAEREAERLEPGGVLLLENLRFHPGEKKPEREPDFPERLARLGDVYVNDAFGTAHRAHASMVAVAARFEVRAAGYLMANEIDYLGRALTAPERPFVTVLGGAKVSDKILLIENLLGRVDALLVGGAMAYTFLRAAGHDVGGSRVEEDRVGLARELIERASSSGVELLLPVDHRAGTEFSADTPLTTTDGPDIPAGKMGLDIGPRTAAAFRETLLAAKTVVWNGPMGVFEWTSCAEGTLAVARACVESDALSIVGGGDSAAAAQASGFADRFDHISTGGGACLEFLEGKSLPGLEALSDR